MIDKELKDSKKYSEKIELWEGIGKIGYGGVLGVATAGLGYASYFIGTMSYLWATATGVSFPESIETIEKFLEISQKGVVGSSLTGILAGVAGVFSIKNLYSGIKQLKDLYRSKKESKNL